MLNGQLLRRMVSMATRVCLSRSSEGPGPIGPVDAAIRAILEQALSPDVLELRKDSGGHTVPLSRKTHCSGAVVSLRFKGMSLLQQHRLIHETLLEELAGQVHLLPSRLGPLHSGGRTLCWARAILVGARKLKEPLDL